MEQKVVSALQARLYSCLLAIPFKKVCNIYFLLQGSIINKYILPGFNLCKSPLFLKNFSGTKLILFFFLIHRTEHFSYSCFSKVFPLGLYIIQIFLKESKKKARQSEESVTSRSTQNTVVTKRQETLLLKSQT